MNSAEIAFLIALLTAFYITLIHPFIVAGCIAALVGYIRWLAPKIDQHPQNEDERTCSEAVAPTETWQQRPVEESEPRSEEENVEVNGRVHQVPMEKNMKKKKSQREILAEIEATREREKYSKLLLTYQVPNMTAYYESLVRIIQQ
ncbi:unnamed protein product [Haemonchus placei]|uniref:Transmembrane protein n=1 Tax=Haemonchus placei TaxID=6290 RepID=A0A0N4WZ65_HAEPC|nr:unnamed protein product [Haemonchus placei]